MLKAERRGEYDISRNKDALVVCDDEGRRVALFVDDRMRRDMVNIAVDLPDNAGTRTYAVGFDWLLNHLRTLEPRVPLAEHTKMCTCDTVAQRAFCADRDRCCRAVATATNRT